VIVELLDRLLPGLAGPPAAMPRNASLENPALSLNDPATWEAFGAKASESGIRVGHQTALTWSPVWQAVSLISGDVAGLQLNNYRRLANDDRAIDRKHPAQFLVSTRPSQWVSAFEFWRRVMVHAPLWGNGYAWIERASRTGPPLGLVNLLPDRTKPMWDKQHGLYYVTEVGGELVTLFPEEVLHVKGVSTENGAGLDLVALMRNAIGLALSAEGLASQFFANGGIAGGILEVPASMGAGARKKLEEGFQKKTGRGNWFKTVLLREGAKWHQTTIDAQKSQQHELREDQVRDAARFFNLPGFKLGLQDSVSYNSAEMAQLIYLVSCLRPWLMAIIGECNLKLLTEAELVGDTHYFEHNLSNLLEIDVKTTNDILEIQRRNEIINANEWRRKINLPGRSDPAAEEYVNPNTRSREAPGQAAGAGGSAGGRSSGGARDQAARRLLGETLSRLTRRVTFDARNQAKKPAKFLAWLDAGDGLAAHLKIFEAAVRPVLDVIDTRANLAPMLGCHFIDMLKDRLTPLIEPPHSQQQLADNVDRACQEFEGTIVAELQCGFHLWKNVPAPEFN